MSEIVERVARAIEASMFAPHELPITDPWLHERYLGTSKAALAAMREVHRGKGNEGMSERATALDDAIKCIQQLYDLISLLSFFNEDIIMVEHRREAYALAIGAIKQLKIEDKETRNERRTT